MHQEEIEESVGQRDRAEAEGNLVDATVRCHPCRVLLDSCSSLSLMSLGLVSFSEETVKIQLFTWAGLLEFDVIEWTEVVVVVQGCVAVNTCMTVIVRGNVMKRHTDRIVMSMSRLQEAEMRQEFHSDDSSTLFLRHPERIEEPLTVLLDTWVRLTCCITNTGLDKVRNSTDNSTLPTTRFLLKFIHATDTLREMNTKRVRHWFDFVFGQTLLSELQTAIRLQ
ncbi:hypothetical protein E2C01_078623 [Portunus trituberculatus]|uniref:Uncharacterized protein n=1 Tax=Portunus trituberculatus TaxID=210409 RepID=A0A5B7INC4_PORTR|nr:hypothetical protein [Portunus trituberculatus]